MDNPKIITIDKDTTVNIYGINETYKTTHSLNTIVISETEDYFFYNYKGKRMSVLKNKIKRVTFKYRELSFSDLKKNDILNVLDNSQKIIKRAQEISEIISRYSIEDNNMNIYDPCEIFYEKSADDLILYKECYTDKEIKIFKCVVPLKYLWDHSWKKNVSKHYKNNRLNRSTLV